LNTTSESNGQQSVGAVAGRVTKTDGTGVSGALLFFTLTTLPVDGVAQLIGSTSLLSAPDGSYAQPFIVSVTPGTVEVEIQITPPIGAQLLPLDTAGIQVHLGATFPPRDTTLVQIVLHGR
jgi:hypothetical protein